MHRCQATFATACQGSETLAQTMHTILTVGVANWQGRRKTKQNERAM